MNEKNISITELARLTHKTRPTIYKYMEDYKLNSFNSIPYPFVELFKMIENSSYTISEIYEYCDKTFIKNTNSSDETINSISKLLKQNINKIDLEEIESLIKERINGK